MVSAVASGLPFFTLSGVILTLLSSNPRSQLTAIISSLSMLILVLLGGGILDFTICMPPVISVLQVPEQINPPFGRNGVIVVAKIFPYLFLNYCG